MSVESIQRAMLPPEARIALESSLGTRGKEAPNAGRFDSITTAKVPGSMNRVHGVHGKKTPWSEPIDRATVPLDRAKVEKSDEPVSSAVRGKAAVAAAAQRPDIQKVATDFAGVLVQQLVREMFESVKEGEGPFGEGPGSDISRGIAETAFSQSLADSGMASLKDAIARAIGEHAPPDPQAAVTEGAPPQPETITKKELSR